MTSQDFDTWFDTYFEEARCHQIDAEYALSEFEAEELYRPMCQEAVTQADELDASQ